MVCNGSPNMLGNFVVKHSMPAAHIRPRTRTACLSPEALKPALVVNRTLEAEVVSTSNPEEEEDAEVGEMKCGIRTRSGCLYMPRTKTEKWTCKRESQEGGQKLAGRSESNRNTRERPRKCAKVEARTETAGVSKRNNQTQRKVKGGLDIATGHVPGNKGKTKQPKKLPLQRKQAVGDGDSGSDGKQKAVGVGKDRRKRVRFSSDKLEYERQVTRREGPVEQQQEDDSSDDEWSDLELQRLNR